MDLQLLKALSEAPGVSGREERVRELVMAASRGLFDETSIDAMGTFIATKKAGGKKGARKKAPHVLFACHIDEIGFYVRHIDDRGFLRLTNAGGFDNRNLLARRVRVQTGSGEELFGLMNPGGRPTHIAKEEDRKKIPEMTDFFVDLCLPALTVKEKVRIGDPVTLVQEFTEIGDCVTGKCLDNRVAAFVVIEALRRVPQPRFEVTLAATVQEEVGCRGAGPAVFGVEPDIAIALDTTLCVDTPGVPEEERVTQQGAGVALTIMDGFSISDRKLIDEFEAIARQRNIPHQLSILPNGGTDAGAMQRAQTGYRTMTYSVPTRYIHTVTECIHKHDLQAAIDLLAAWLEG